MFITTIHTVVFNWRVWQAVTPECTAIIVPAITTKWLGYRFVLIPPATPCLFNVIYILTALSKKRTTIAATNDIGNGSTNEAANPMAKNCFEFVYFYYFCYRHCYDRYISFAYNLTSSPYCLYSG
jgi:hypothetical protein